MAHPDIPGPQLTLQERIELRHPKNMTLGSREMSAEDALVLFSQRLTGPNQGHDRLLVFRNIYGYFKGLVTDRYSGSIKYSIAQYRKQMGMDGEQKENSDIVADREILLGILTSMAEKHPDLAYIYEKLNSAYEHAQYENNPRAVAPSRRVLP